MTIGEFLSDRTKNNLDLLRLFAAALVIYAHGPINKLSSGPDVGYWLTGGRDYSGNLAVQFFFFTSGVLVTGSLLNSYIPRWVAARILRIFPAYILLLIITAFALGPVFTALKVTEYFSSPEVAGYLTNNLGGMVNPCCLQWTLPGVFQSHPNQVVNGAIWTLPWELRCYALVLVLGIAGGLRFRGFATLLIVLVGSLEFVSSFQYLGSELWLMPCFAAGMLCAVWQDRIHLRADVALLLLLLAVLSYGQPYSRAIYLPAIFYGSLVLASWPPFARLKPKSDLSYGVYLYGWPCQQVVFELVPKLPLLLQDVLSLMAASVFALVSWHLIEKRAIGWAGKIRPWSKAKTIAATPTAPAE
jgi:peptidoglycan/LPS O-acetylase OafA/YrhL